MKKVATKKTALEGKVVLITGAAGLLGQAYSRACALAGATVIMIDIDAEKGERIAAAIRKDTKQSSVAFFSCNCTDTEAIRTLLKEIKKTYKRIDALVNNAYPRNKQYGRKFEDVTYEDFCDNLNLQLGGYFLMSQEVSRIMTKQGFGNIVLMGSIYGVVAPRFKIYDGTPMTMPVEYAAVKGGVVMLTKYLAAYLGKNGIRVNCISPGGIEDTQPKQFIDAYVDHVRLEQRMARPDDVSGVLTFLLSDASTYVTGHNLIVDGGWTL